MANQEKTMATENFKIAPSYAAVNQTTERRNWFVGRQGRTVIDGKPGARNKFGYPWEHMYSIDKTTCNIVRTFQ